MYEESELSYFKGGLAVGIGLGLLLSLIHI